MEEQAAEKRRPYWHVDAKWISGLLLVLSLTATLVVLILYQLTVEERAVDTLSRLLASAVSPGGLDDATDITELRRQLDESDDGRVRPFPGLLVEITSEDVTGRTPRQIRLDIFRQIVEPFYQEGRAGLAGFTDDPDMTQTLQSDIGQFSLFTRASHLQLERALWILGGVSLLLLFLLALFSNRFGRLGSPGCAFLVAGLPGALLLSAAYGSLTGDNASQLLAQGEELSRMLATMATEALPDALWVGLWTYWGAAGVGIVLLLAATLGSLIWQLSRPAPAIGDTAAPPPPAQPITTPAREERPTPSPLDEPAVVERPVAAAESPAPAPPLVDDLAGEELLPPAPSPLYEAPPAAEESIWESEAETVVEEPPATPLVVEVDEPEDLEEEDLEEAEPMEAKPESPLDAWANSAEDEPAAPERPEDSEEPEEPEESDQSV